MWGSLSSPQLFFASDLFSDTIGVLDIDSSSEDSDDDQG